jgi:hypothetical protein
MFYHPRTQKYIEEGQPFSIGELQYPHNWLNLSTQAEKEELGLLEVSIVGTRENDQDYWVSETREGAVITITNTPKDPEQIKERKNAEIKRQIEQLELSQLLPRIVRLDMLQRAQVEADKLGLTLEQIYFMATLPEAPTAAVSYKKLKDFDDSITELRSKLIP